MKKVLIFLLVVVSGVLVVGFFIPKQKHSECTTNISAPSNLVFNQVNTLKNWDHWLLLKEIAPDAEIALTGPASGIGCTMSWNIKSYATSWGIKKRNICCGLQTITVSEPNRYVSAEVTLNCKKYEITSSFRFVEESDGTTKVTWRMDSTITGNIFHQIFYKYLDIFMQPKIKEIFNKGLENLKQYTEDLEAQRRPEGTEESCDEDTEESCCDEHCNGHCDEHCNDH